MSKTVLLALVLAMPGCTYYTPPIEEATAISRERVEALNARSECRALARNLVQIARCDGR